LCDACVAFGWKPRLTLLLRCVLDGGGGCEFIVQVVLGA